MPNNGETGADPDLFGDQNLVQIVHAPNGLAVERNNQIALPQSGVFGRTVFLYRHNEYTGFERQIIKSDHATMQRHILTGYANVAAPDLSVPYQPSGDEPGCVARNGKADALGRANHGRVHADYFACGVNEWPAGVARIQCRVGLNNVVD